MNNLSAGPLWDLSLPPSLPALADEDFITLLQKQFGANNGFPGGDPVFDDNDKEAVPPTNNINPQNLTRIPIPRPVDSPPSDDDSSPSPREASASRSRRESGAFDMEGSSRYSEDFAGDDDPSLKRKAGEDDLDNEPNHKTPHTSTSKKNNPSRRRSTGNPAVDENRFLKRKEQNRAAQRAFRERKEKHVKDLEDKVAALEEKNAAALQENETLREVVSRLQSENMRLRQSSFTFSVPASSAGAASGSSQTKEPGTNSRMGSSDMQQEAPMSLFGSPPSTTTSSTASTHDSPESLFANENHDGQLSFLGQNLFTLNSSAGAAGGGPQQQHQQQQQQQQQQHTATADAMNMDLGFGPVLTHTPYTTIASNPLFMSFREPDMFDSLSQSPPNSGENANGNGSGNGSHSHGTQGQGQSQSQQPFDFSQHLFSNGWQDVSMNGGSMQAFDLTNSLDELFGATYNNNNGAGAVAGLDFTMGGLPVPGVGKTSASPVNSLSPISHQNGSGGSGSSSSPGASSSSSSAGAASSPEVVQGSPEVSSTAANGCGGPKKCTREVLARAIAQDGGSMFAPPQQQQTTSLSLNRSEDSSPGPSSMRGTGTGMGMGMGGPVGTSGDDSCDEFPPCKGLQLPKTQRSEHNVEVMSAWRTIRQDPKFQDVDINQLCSEFASKARCDGCHVVIEPSGMQEILEAVQMQKRAKQQRELFSASEALVAAAAAAGTGTGGGGATGSPLGSPLLSK